MRRFISCSYHLSVLLLFLSVTFVTVPAQTGAASISAVAFVVNPTGLTGMDASAFEQDPIPSYSNSTFPATQSSAKFLIYAPEPENILIAIRYENNSELQVYPNDHNTENENVILPGPSPATAILDLNSIISDNSADSPVLTITIYNTAI